VLSITLSANLADIRVGWNALDTSLNGGSAVLGYYLQIDGGFGTDFIEPGVQIVLPATLEHTFSGLIKGAVYRIRIAAYNAIYTANSFGSQLRFSPALSTVAALAPAQITSLAQTLTDLQKGKITLQWTAPSDNGSPITSYVLSKDNGSGVYFEVYRGLGLSFTDSQPVGGSATYKVVAVNAAGTGTESAPFVGIAGQKPSAPLNFRITTQSTTALVVEWDLPENSGDLAISNYIVNVDNADMVYGADISTALLTYTKTLVVGDIGKRFSFKVAAQNALGIGEYSEQIQLLAADAPDAPSLSLTTRGSNWLLLKFTPGASDGGSALTKYQLFKDAGVVGSPLKLIASVTPEQIVYNATDLIPGQTYAFELYAFNGAHQSAAFSTSFMIGTVPSKAKAPWLLTSARGTIGGSTGTISVEWSAVTSPQGWPVTNYLLYIDNQGDGVFSLVSNSTNLSTLQYQFTGLADTAEYRIKVAAENAIGAGEESDEVLLAVATKPGTIDPPIFETATESSISIAWTPPSDNGGSPLTGYRVYMNDFLSDKIEMIYDGSSVPSILSFTEFGLILGAPYRFQVSALNRVGESDPSAFETFY